MKNPLKSALGVSSLVRFSRKALLSAGAAAILAAGNAYSALTAYTATFSGTATAVNYDWASVPFQRSVSAGNSDVIVISFSADPDTLVGQSTYTTSMNYSVTAGSFPTYTGSADLTISLTQTANGTEFQFLNSDSAINTNDAGVFRVDQITTLSLTDVASILTLANQGIVSASNFSTFIWGSNAINSNAIGTTSIDGSLGALYNTNRQPGGTSYISATLSPQDFLLTSTPEPSSAALLGVGAGAAAFYLFRRRKGQNLVDVVKLARKDSPRVG